MAKISKVWCIYNQQNNLITVSTTEVEAWLKVIKSENELAGYFTLLSQGYYSEEGEVIGK